MSNVTLMQGDCLDKLKELDDNSVDSIVTDPPYGLSFMGKAWDKAVPSVDVWAECLRVLKPGGHLLAFAGTRTQHRMAVNIEDAGFEIRDMIAWVYGCLSEDTEIATPDGTKPYTAINTGDLVLCYDKYTQEYTYQPVENVYEYNIKDTAYRIQSDYTDQVVSRNHRCLVERGGREVFILAEELETQENIPFLEDLSGLQETISGTDNKKTFVQNRSSASYQSRSIRQSHRESDVVCEQQRSQAVRSWTGHKTTLATVTPFEYEGKIWCVKVPTGSFVAVRNGKAFTTGNSGFPKSQNVSKAIGKAAGHKRSTEYEPNYKNSTFGEGMGGGKHGSQSEPPVTQSAKQWDGWGTALKPALEPITVARKPLTGTVAANVMEHGTGAINIDGCRVDGGERLKREVHPLRDNVNYQGNALEGRKDQSLQSSKATGTTTQGRWPANLIHDGSDEVVELFPITKSGAMKKEVGEYDGNSVTGFMRGVSGPSNQHGDQGSAARFFYCPKASKKDRNKGLTQDQVNNHPTVKPTELMKYLCRLITPPGGTVLDPFMGSGSTGKAARQEGFDFIGIEIDPEYVEIAKARIGSDNLSDFFDFE